MLVENPFTMERISIHAPVKGATKKLGGGFTVAYMISIHAPVKGATAAIDDDAPARRNFNPRTREGCDKEIAKVWPHAKLFQSTHP